MKKITAVTDTAFPIDSDAKFLTFINNKTRVGLLRRSRTMTAASLAGHTIFVSAFRKRRRFTIAGGCVCKLSRLKLAVESVSFFVPGRPY